jgi:cytochrome c-type biogenesis protein CcmH/NrfG
MENQARLFLGCFLLLIICSETQLANAQSAGIPFRPTTIHGIVRDAVSHNPIEHAIVMLEREDSGYVGQTETDGMGKFTFQGPGQMVFVVKAKIPGHQEQIQRVDMTIRTSEYLTFDLQPTGSNSPGSAPAAGSLSAREAAIPENARKEYATARDLFSTNKPGEDGVRHLKKAIQIYPKYSDAYVLLGMAYIEENKPDDAKTALGKAIEIDPKLAEAYLTLGMLQNHQQAYADAEKNLTQGLELNPDAPQGQYELAKTYWAMGRWQDADPHVQKALSLKPDMAPAHVLMGNVALRKRDAQTALKEFQEYLRLDPNGPMADGTRQMVVKIENALKNPAQ